MTQQEYDNLPVYGGPISLLGAQIGDRFKIIKFEDVPVKRYFEVKETGSTIRLEMKID